MIVEDCVICGGPATEIDEYCHVCGNAACSACLENGECFNCCPPEVMTETETRT